MERSDNQFHTTLPSSLLLVLILVSTAYIYWPGLTGNFIFDDYPNLKKLGTSGGVNDLDSLYNYLQTGFAGPTGRPISLLSFLIDDNGWPSEAFGFKRTNLLIHLLTGLMLCWSSFKLLLLTGRKPEVAAWIAVISGSIWLMHPYFLSTTLYVVQRMAQLATLFSLVGILGYLHGRQKLSSNPNSAYIWMTFSLGAGTLLATFSKENGALLPLMVLVLELTLGKHIRQPGLNRIWQGVILWAPSMAVVGYLVSEINFKPNIWPSRPFDQVERLLSEARIIWEYLFHLLIPRIEGRGLYQDSYPISTELWSPPQTAMAVAGIALLLLFAIYLRKKLPIVSFAILFFFTGHLLESTVIGLELYFEHRNYMPAVFLFLPLAIGLERMKQRYSTIVVLLVITAIFCTLGFMTYQRAQLWSSATNLQLYWAVNTPDSPRAQNAIAQAFVDRAEFDKAIAHLDQANKKIPDSPLLTVSLLLHKVYARKAEFHDFDETAKRLITQPFDAQALMAVKTMVNMATTPPLIKDYLTGSLSIVDSIEKNERYTQMHIISRVTPYLKARLYLSLGEIQTAMQHYLVAMDHYRDTDANLTMVVEMASYGFPREALVLLDKTKKLYSQQSVSSLKRSRTTYEMEFSRIESMIISDMEQDLETGTSVPR